MSDAVITVKDLRKAYKNNAVLKGVSFQIRKGEIFSLLGSNGAGKTTTIKILSTLLLPDSGNISILDFDVVKNAGKVREQISLTGQYAAVDENLTGRENLRMIASLRHLPNVKKKADELLTRFNLMDAADRRVSAYSGGMRRRLDLAMSLMGNPPVIFLDEPTTGLDPQSRLSMWKIIKSLSKSGTTILLTTQYLEEAEQLADYIAILNEGVIAAEGTVSKLKELLPTGVIEFAFHNEADLREAGELLKDYNARSNEELQTLSVTTNHGIEQLSDILMLLKSRNIPTSRFGQKEPTLEEVFLTLVGESKGDD